MIFLTYDEYLAVVTGQPSGTDAPVIAPLDTALPDPLLNIDLVCPLMHSPSVRFDVLAPVYVLSTRSPYATCVAADRFVWMLLKPLGPVTSLSGNMKCAAYQILQSAPVDIDTALPKTSGTSASTLANSSRGKASAGRESRHFILDLPLQADPVGIDPALLATPDVLPTMLPTALPLLGAGVGVGAGVPVV